jgi:hypothetical protein
MMVAKVRRVAANPKKPIRASSRRNGAPKKRKLSAKQIKHFGTKRQKAALTAKRRRSTGAGVGRSTTKPVVVIVRSAKARRPRRAKRNPIQALTLGFMNPRKGGTIMAKRKRKVRARAFTGGVKRRRKNSASGRRRTARSVSMVRRNSRRGGKRNPAFFGSSVTTTEMIKYIGGGLIGVAATKALVPMLPDSLRGSQAMAVASSLAVAVAVGWAASKVDVKIGSMVLFGGLMQAASVFLNSYVPPVGRFIGLSGGRGVGEFVPARFPVPQNPILQSGGGGMTMAPSRAYQSAY